MRSRIKSSASDLSSKLPRVIGTLAAFSIILVLTLSVLSVRPVFAAKIFEDGFETGDFSKWSPVVGTATVTSGDAHHGIYKAILDHAGEYAQARFLATPVDHCFMEAYVMFKAFPATGSETTVLGVYNLGSSRYMAEARVANVAGTMKWRLRYWHNGVHYTVTSEQQKPILDTWYCVEVEGKSNTITNAESRIYIDGNELTDVSQTGRNNNLPITCGYIWANTAVTRWYDCVVIDTDYINPEYKLTMDTNFGTTSPSVGDHMYTTGSKVTISATAPAAGSGEQYVWTSWTGTGGGSYSGTDNFHEITIDNTAITETASWTRQWYITVASAHGSPTQSSQWVNDGDPFSVSVTTPDGDATHQWVLTGLMVDGTPQTVDSTVSFVAVHASHTIVFDWKEQLWVSFTQSGLDNSATGTVVTIDGVPETYADLPVTGWFDSGTTYSYGSTVSSTASGKQFILTGVAGPTPPIGSPGTVNGNYKTQYYLTVGTWPSALTPVPVPPSGWYDEGTRVTLTAPKMANYMYAPFTSWSLEWWLIDSWAPRPLPVIGADPPQPNPTEILMDAPKYAMATYHRTVPDPVGDVNIDGVTDVLDIALIAKSYGAVRGETRYSWYYDVYLDGRIDLIDLATAARHMNL